MSSILIISGIFDFWYTWQDWQKFLLIGGGSILLLLILVLVIWGIVASSRKKRNKNKIVVSEERAQDIGKMTLEFADAIFKAANPQNSRNGQPSVQSNYSRPAAPITLVLNSPSSVDSESMGLAGLTNNNHPPVRPENLNIKKDLVKEYGADLSKDAFYAVMVSQATDGMLKERIYEEIYLPKKYTRQRFFHDRELVKEMLRREKKRMYKLYKSGLSVIDACKSRHDLEREAILSTENTLDYIFGFNAESAAKTEDVQLLKSRREKIMEIKRNCVEEIKYNVETSTGIREEEKRVRADLDALTESLKGAKKKEKKESAAEIERLNNLIYLRDKEADECERVILFKDKLIKECENALGKISQRLYELNALDVQPGYPSENKPKINSAQTSYDSIETEIESLEKEKDAIDRYLVELEFKIQTAPENIKRKMMFRRIELSEKSKYISKRINILKNGGKSNENALKDDSLTDMPAEKLIKVQTLHRRLRLTETESEAYAIVNKLYDIKLKLNDAERNDALLNANLEKAIKDGLHAAELNKYKRVLQDYRRKKRL